MDQRGLDQEGELEGGLLLDDRVNIISSCPVTLRTVEKGKHSPALDSRSELTKPEEI